MFESEELLDNRGEGSTPVFNSTDYRIEITKQVCIAEEREPSAACIRRSPSFS